MPRVIECASAGEASLQESIDALAGAGFDPGDEDSLALGASILRRLANNRRFLGDLMIDCLRERHRHHEPASAYGPQAIVLGPLRNGSFLRANIWPSERDGCFRASGAHSFVYGMPHDHNFSFLTVGYFGPGYESDYYEYDYAATAGYVGETPGLRFVERSALGEGRMLLYRAHRDIHSQLPAASMSVSLNILHIDPGQGWFDQYGFDLESGAITGLLNPTSTEVFLRCAVGLGDAAAVDLAEDFGRHHPSDRMRLASYEARASLGGDEDGLWREAERSGSLMVAEEATARRRALERN
ncbi:transposase [Qipengyuania spongiae]|uniref:Transposase n=1 Tax=Qipengyuania spongiae TaxID=2909673 RepID=A0ABY5SV72_9SPHN|nr:transposase [Qipengyuania spongiae]UVI38453.1 transposase [Qipengyuania spongiae]